MFESFVILMSLAGIFSYINHRFLKLPGTVGVTIIAIATALPLSLLELIDPDLFHRTCSIITSIDFKTLLFDVMLSLLLFAGALHLQLRDLNLERKSILSFATLGVLISTVVVGFLIFSAAQMLGLQLNLGYALIFGALISPTDPIAALAILKEIGVNKSLESKIAGESLFNDGIGVVVFIVVVSFFTKMGDEIGAAEVFGIFAKEALGGVAFGIALGWLGYELIRRVADDQKIQVMLSLALAMGGYALCIEIGVSGPLAMVVAALMLGRKMTKNPKLIAYKPNVLQIFWSMLDEILNTILFVLIGLELLVLAFEWDYVWISLFAIPSVLLARYVSVYIVSNIFPDKNDGNPSASLKILTWGGLRGAISIALALSLPESEYRDLVVFITYAVVVFSIVVQGLSIKSYAKKLKLTTN